MTRKFFSLINIGLTLNLALLLFKYLIRVPENTNYSDQTKGIFVLKASNTSYFFSNDDKNHTSQESLSSTCTMQSCFNFSACTNLDVFKIYIYDNVSLSNSNNDHSLPHSVLYTRLLASLRHSAHFTDDPRLACLFVVPYDTLSRDRLSVNYVQQLDVRLNALGFWHGGRNHIIFNLYSGSYPAYTDDDLALEQSSMAIVAKASFARPRYRRHFDVAFPLFHAEMLLTHAQHKSIKSSRYLGSRKYLLTFKGKRYLHGIGSETRNAVHHLNNGRDILLLTTW